ncbi:MAG: FxsA family protein [Bradymonadia bacterium]
MGLYLLFELLIFWGIWRLHGLLLALGINFAFFLLGLIFLRAGRGSLRRFQLGASLPADGGGQIAYSVAGVLLMLPGVLTSLAGLLVLVPKTRRALQRVFSAYLGRAIFKSTPQGFDVFSGFREYGGKDLGERESDVADLGEVIDVEYEEI